jgi:hypothetical protein
MEEEFNPFALNSYFGVEYFCDRENEIKTLMRNIRNRNSTTLISRRRMGKTLLIQHLFNVLPPKHIGISLDIFSTNSRKEFLDNLSTAIIRNVPEESSIGKKIWKFIRSLQPNISFDPFTGSPQVNINVSPHENDRYIESIFDFLEQQSHRIVIAIDEFQQILTYKEEHTDVWMRTFIQKLNNVVFIFSGSQTHLMTQLFTDPTRAFYRSTKFIHLEKIDSEIYSKFIVKHFRKAKCRIPKAIVNDILDWTYGHTYYVQALCSAIYDNREKEITEDIVKKSKLEILTDEDFLFMKLRGLLSPQQWKLLIAVAKEAKLIKPTSAEFISKYELGSSAVVLRSLNALINKDLVYYSLTEDSIKYYAVGDVFFERWAQWKFY